MHQNLAVKIRELIEKNNLSVQGLEKRAGLKLNVVRNILVGKSKKPSAELLLSIARVFKCSISELLEEEAYQPSGGLVLKDLSFPNHALLSDTLTHIIKAYGALQKTVDVAHLLSLTQEIYAYSAENNKGQLDKTFTRWLCAQKLQKAA